jgi:hypothetical protein
VLLDLALNRRQTLGQFLGRKLFVEGWGWA